MNALRILHIDDDSGETTLLEYNLRKECPDLEFVWCESGQSALDMLEVREFDCIISDFQMVGVNGLQLLKRIREKNNHTPFIFLTGQGNEELAAEAFRSGADDYFSKDSGKSHYQKLLNSIRRAVGARAMERQLRIEHSHLDFLFNHSPLAIVVGDVNSIIRRVNPGFCSLFEYKPEQVIGRHIDDVVVDEAYFEEAVERSRLAESGHSFSAEVVRRTATGKMIQVGLTGSPVFDESGRQIAIYAIYQDLSKLSRTERSLTQSEEKYRNIFQNAQVGLFRTRISDSVMLECNDQAARMLGYGSREEVIGKVSVADHYTDIGDRDKIYTDLAETGEIRDHEVLFRRNDGSEIFLRVSARISTEEGCVDGVVEDVTVLKKNEQTLKESEERLRRILGSVPVGMLSVDKENKSITNVNGLAARIFGEEPDRISGRVVSDFLLRPEAGHESNSRPVPEASMSEYVARRSNGSTIPVLLSETEIMIDGREHLLYTFFDITYLKQIEEEVKLKDFALDSTITGIIFTSLDATITYANPAVIKMWGYELADQIIGKKVFEFVRSEKDVIAIIRELRIKGNWYGEIQGVRRDGGSFDTQLAASLIFDRKGEPVSMIASFADITDLKQTQQELKTKHAQLQQYSLKLENLNEELKSFSYSVSHDLKAPLRHIEGYCELLNEISTNNEDNQKYLERITLSCRKMGGLIDDLLKLSRISTEELSHDYVDLSVLAETVFREIIGYGGGHTVECSIADGLSAYGDANLMKVVLENLISNAVKFSSKSDKPKIEIGQCQSNGIAEFYVRDNGAGFDPADADKLFVPFKRLHSSKDYEGTGIGLSTAQRIIHRHGGHIRAEGRPGEGATFYFTL